MKVKALLNFSGIISMTKNEIRDIENKEIYEDLIKAGYVEPVKDDSNHRTRKKVNANEN